jgi:hypothetical protein
MAYLVSAGDGGCLYLGDDLELACELHDQDPGAHLAVVTPVLPPHRSDEAPWRGPTLSTAVSA